MINTEQLPIENRTLTMGEEMSSITFSQLVKELTGVPFDVVYKDYISQGEDNEQGYLE